MPKSKKSWAKIKRGLKFNLNLTLGVIALASTFFTVRLLTTHASDGGNIVSIARGQIDGSCGSGCGHHETGNNCNAYGPCEQWCADFVSWVYRKAGDRFIKGTYDWRIPITGDMQSWFQAHGQWYNGYQLSHIQPGDMVYTAGDGSGHVGIVVSANGGGIDTIAGNYGDAVREYQTAAGDVIGTGHFDNWYAFSGAAKDIGAGRDGVFIAGTNGDLYQRHGSEPSGGSWTDLGGGGLVKRVDVDDSSVWTTNGSSNTLVRYINGTFRGMNAVAADVGAGWTGHVYLTGTNGHTYRWTGKTDCPGHTLSYCWPTLASSPYMLRIEGTGGGGVWAMSNESDQAGNVYSSNGTSPWAKFHGGLLDAGIGPNNESWGVNHNGAIFFWNGSSWETISGGGYNITVDSHGIPWMLSSSGTIYRYMRG